MELRHKLARLLVALSLGSLWARPALAQDAPPEAPPGDPPAQAGESGEAAGANGAADNPIRGDEITPELEQAVERGLAFLASRQAQDGSFGGAGGGGATTAVTALSAIAIMSSGNLPGRGKYGANVARAVDYIINNAEPSGLLSDADSHGSMYAHGFATLFLAEIYGMTGDERVKEPLSNAIRLIQGSQNDEGGWRYQPRPVEADISVTICQVMGLRAARDAGIKVEKSVIDKAIAYVKGLQNDDGGFNYMAQSSNSSEFPRSAAGVATLYYAGVSEGEAVEEGLEYLQRFTPGRRGGSINYYYYGHYYAVQAMFLAGGNHWAEWYPAIRDEILAQQNPDGSWPSKEVSQEYCTAMALIILQMPNRYLPVFSGKGAGS